MKIVVDSALQVIDVYQSGTLEFERPKVSTVRKGAYSYFPAIFILHILSKDLLHKRTLGLSKTLIYVLRRYDKDRCTAHLDPDEAAHTKVVGFMSMKATIYLADMPDRMEIILTSLDMYEAMVENLVNFIFNVCFHGICSRLQQDINHFIDDMNEVM